MNRRLQKKLNAESEQVYKKSQISRLLYENMRLRRKSETLHKDLNDYKITFKGFSLKDM